MTWSGKTKRVKSYLKITLDSGHVYKVTHNHIFYTKNRGKEFSASEISADKLRVGDYLLKTIIKDSGKSLTYKRDLSQNYNYKNIEKFHHGVLHDVYDICLQENEIVHHKDENYKHNDKKNLDIISSNVHNRHHKLINNPAKLQSVHKKRVTNSKKFKGITNGNYHKEWTKEQVINETVNCIKRGELARHANSESSWFDYEYTKNACNFGLPGVTKLLNSKEWGFTSKFDFISQVKEHINIDIRKCRKSQSKRVLGEIIDIQECDECIDVYDITVKDNHTFILDSGCVVHNCNNYLKFTQRKGKLDMTVYVRSQDMIWGFVYDVVHWTLLQQQMANMLGVKCGTYWHIMDSAHIYKHHYEMANRIIQEDNPPKIKLPMDMNATSFMQFKLMCSEVVKSIDTEEWSILKAPQVGDSSLVHCTSELFSYHHKDIEHFSDGNPLSQIYINYINSRKKK